MLALSGGEGDESYCITLTRRGLGIWFSGRGMGDCRGVGFVG